MRIHLLPESLAHQIAAGEVIEGPASVVKELVENAIDARSSSIQIQITDEKKRKIIVIDNGIGIHEEDLILAFSRHATSKIQTMEDFYALKSLGFRGEALSSIASISHLTIKTRREGAVCGSLLVLRGGEIQKRDELAMNPGTRIEVEDLFYNTPARLKYLRDPKTEFTHISSVCTRLALGFPQISFQLLHNGREVLRTPSKGNLIDTIYSIYDEGLASLLLPLDYSQDYVQIQGYISPSTYSRKTTRQIFFYVNNRWIVSPLLKNGVLEAYRGYLLQGRYPFALIKVSLNPIHFDANVHPQKETIRFSRPKTIVEVLLRAMKETLKQNQKVPSIPFHPEDTTSLVAETQSNLPLPFSPPNREEDRGAASLLEPLACESINGPLFFLGELFNTFLLFQGPQALYLIDQHAAHERILFHRLRKETEKGSLSSQLLLTPLALEVSFEEKAYLDENQDLLKSLQFQLEPFGPKSFLLRGVPEYLKDLSSESLKDLFWDLLNAKKDGDYNLLCTIACHGAIKAGKHLGKEEVKRLWIDLEKTDNPFHCPHGRPTILSISQSRLERSFKRS